MAILLQPMLALPLALFAPKTLIRVVTKNLEASKGISFFGQSDSVTSGHSTTVLGWQLISTYFVNQPRHLPTRPTITHHHHIQIKVLIQAQGAFDGAEDPVAAVAEGAAAELG